MTSAVLQILAMLCMLADHIGLFLMHDNIVMRGIGRLAIPLFAMGLVEGFIHTKSRSKYFLRLAICALVAEIPTYLLLKNFNSYPIHNVLFSYLLGFAAMLCLEKKSLYLWALTPIFALLATILRIDYGFPVVMLIMLFYLCRKYLKKKKTKYYIALLMSLALTEGVAAAIAGWWLQLIAIAAFIPLALYNGKKGHRLPKYAGYIFFPAHLLIIWLIALLLH